MPDHIISSEGVGLREDAKNATASVLQYVTFELAGQSYGVNIGDAVEVIRMVDMADPPEAPPYVVGVINIRGQIVPIIDMRRRLRLQSANLTLTTPILVAKVRNWTLGLIVDKIKEVVTISPTMIEPSSESFSRSRCVASVAKIGANLIFLLDLSGLFIDDESRFAEKLFSASPMENKALV